MKGGECLETKQKAMITVLDGILLKVQCGRLSLSQCPVDQADNIAVVSDTRDVSMAVDGAHSVKDLEVCDTKSQDHNITHMTEPKKSKKLYHALKQRVRSHEGSITSMNDKKQELQKFLGSHLPSLLIGGVFYVGPRGIN